jgi:hypothetical protein
MILNMKCYNPSKNLAVDEDIVSLQRESGFGTVYSPHKKKKQTNNVWDITRRGYLSFAVYLTMLFQ